MDGKGRCMDNIVVERLWRSLKYEEVYLNAYGGVVEAKAGIGILAPVSTTRERQHQAWAIAHRVRFTKQNAHGYVDDRLRQWRRLRPHPHRHNSQPQD